MGGGGGAPLRVVDTGVARGGAVWPRRVDVQLLLLAEVPEVGVDEPPLPLLEMTFA